MISAGVKTTIYSVCPDAIVADVDVLRQAPLKMLQAGLGDMLAKYISVCEWRISNIINGEYYCEEVAALMRRCVRRIVEAAPQPTQRSPQAVMQVMEGDRVRHSDELRRGIAPRQWSEHYCTSGRCTR